MENIADKLFNILRTKFNNTDIKTLTTAGKETTDMEEVGMFSFDFIVEDDNYGPVVILLAGGSDNVKPKLEVYYGDNTSRGLPRTAKKKWENLTTHLSSFARRSCDGFGLNHTTDLKYDLANVDNITESYKNIFEGYYGTKKTSYNKQGKAKIIIKHTRALGEDEKRFRHISSLFVENADGERFKLPFTKLTGARAMARHVTEGGNPYDLFGVHISEMVKDINTLGGFVRRSKMFEDDEETSGLVETGRTHYAAMRKGLKQIAGKRGYHTFKENWEPSEITECDTDTDAIRSKFTERSVNQRVEEALPLLARLQKMAEAQSTAPIGSGSIENRERFAYGDRVESITNPGGNYEVVGTKGDKVRVQSDSDIFYTVDASDLRFVDESVDEGQYDDEQQDKFWKSQARQNGVDDKRNNKTREPGKEVIPPYDKDYAAGYGDDMDELKEFESWTETVIEEEVDNDVIEESFTIDTLSGSDAERARNFLDTNDVRYDQVGSEIRVHLNRNSLSASSLLSKLHSIAQFDEDVTEEVVAEDTWAIPDNDKKMSALTAFFTKEQPLGIDALNVTDALHDIVGNDELYGILKSQAEHDPEADARSTVYGWIVTNLPHLKKSLMNVSKVQQEGLNAELDADDETQLNASVNQTVDDYVNEDEMVQFKETEDNMTKLFTEYVAEAEENVNEADDNSTCVHCGETGELTYDSKAMDSKCGECGEWQQGEEVNEDAEVVEEETTIELEEAHDGPIVAMSDGDDLGALMQRTNHLLNK